MPTLRREVEIPRRSYERASIYLGIASLLVSLLIVLDAARWSNYTARARQDAIRHDRATAAARLRAVRCRAAREAEARAAAETATREDQARAARDPHRVEFRRQAAEQLAQPWASVDKPAAGRYGKMNRDAIGGGSPGNSERAARKPAR